MRNILLGSVVASNSPRGSLNTRNLINILFTGLIACIPLFLNNLTLQLQTLEWGRYGWLLPVVLIVIKTISETFTGKK